MPITVGGTTITMSSGAAIQDPPGTAPAYLCRAWVNFNGTNAFSPNPSTTAIRASGNVTSITDNGVGDYTVNFTTAMTDVNYAYTASSNANGGVSFANPSLLSTGSVRLQTQNAALSKHDSAAVMVAIFR